MLKTGCSGKTGLVLAYHQPEIVDNCIVTIIMYVFGTLNRVWMILHGLYRSSNGLGVTAW